MNKLFIPDIGGFTATDINKGRKLTVPQWADDYFEEFGRQVGSEQAARFMTSSWAYRCIEIRSNTLAGVPWEVLKPGEDDNGEEALIPVNENHPLVKLLKEVNPEMNGHDLLRATEADLMIYGRAYWEKVGKTKTVGLKRLNPGTMKVKAGRKGIEGFVQEINGEEVASWERDKIVYFHTYHPTDDFGGLSPLQVAMPDVDIEINADKYVAAFFENYAMPPFIASFKEKLAEGEFKRRVSLWKRLFGGVKKQHKTALMDADMSVQMLGYSLKDLALAELRAEARRAICAAFGVPPAIAGAWEAANYASSREQRLSLVQDTVQPQAEYMAGVLNAELVPQYGERLQFAWRFRDLPIMQEDENTKAKRIAMLVEKRVIKRAVGARELGYSEEEAAEDILPPVFEPSSNGKEPKENKNYSPFVEDLQKWSRKSMKRVQEGKAAAVDFTSRYIPKALHGAIMGALEEAETKEDVYAIFDGAYDYEFHPYARVAKAD